MLVDNDLIEVQDTTVNENDEELLANMRRIDVVYGVPPNAVKNTKNEEPSASDTIVIEEVAPPTPTKKGRKKKVEQPK